MRSLELAGEQATLLGLQKVDIRHLLLGLLAEGHGVAAQLLETAGIRISDVQRLESPPS